MLPIIGPLMPLSPLASSVSFVYAPVRLLFGEINAATFMNRRRCLFFFTDNKLLGVSQHLLSFDDLKARQYIK